MNKIFVYVRTIANLFICKILHWKKLRIRGIPFCIRFSNLQFLEGSISFGRRINVSKGTLLSVNGGKIVIGELVFFNRNCQIVSHGLISIGNRCRFGPNVCLFDHDHEYGLDGVNDRMKVGKIYIGDKCWLGANVVILRDSEIGDCCIIGAGVVFKGKLPPYSLVYNDVNGLVIKSIADK